MKYKVKPVPKGWMVLNEHDKPCHKSPHKTLKAAEYHCLMLNAIFG